MAFRANNTVCPIYSTVTEVFIVYHQNKVMHKKKLGGKCKSQDSNRYLEECMSVGGNAQWTILSPSDINMLYMSVIVVKH